MEELIANIEHLIEQGRYLEARPLAQEAVNNNPSLRLQQLHALAISKSGMPGVAKDYLEKIYAANPQDAETAGILGGIYKTLFRQTEESEYAVQSRDTYLRNFSLTGNYYTGINAATMSAIAGQARKGREIAKEVIEKIGETNEFWELATLGEAYLLSKDPNKSVACYLKACQLAGTDWGKISSVYNQLWLLKHYMSVSSDILKIFSPPTVVAFVGHMIDHPERSTPRFPTSIQDSIRAAIKSTIKSQKAAIGYCSLACGSDILFAEAMEEEGGELNIFLPFNRDDFIETSVAFAGESWVSRFEKLEERHPVTYVTHEAYDDYNDLFSMQSKIVLGSTILRGSLMHTNPYLISVLSDLDLSMKEGGTRDNISLWPFPDKKSNISPNVNLTNNATQEKEATSSNGSQSKASARPALYLLVIDIETENEETRNKFVELAILKFEEAMVPPLGSCMIDSKLIAGFAGLRPLMDFVSLLRKTKGVSENQLKLTVSGGPIALEDFHDKDTVQYKVMKGAHLQALLKTHAYSTAGSCVVATPIAYELPLYQIDIALLSRVNLEGAEAVDLYRVVNG